MANGARRNIALNAVAVCVAASGGVAGYLFPSIPCAIASAAITALSVIFGLSLALLAIGSEPASISGEFIRDDFTRKWAEGEVNRQKSRLIARQQALLLTFLITVFSGLVFLGADAAVGPNVYSRAIGAVFVSLTTLSMCYSLFLPFTLSRSLKMKSELRSRPSPP